VANVEGGKVTVWASTQRPFPAQEDVAQALGMPVENVHIITPFVGGAFGGKEWNKHAIEAARLAKLTGKPVQVMWSRAEEFFYDTFQPAAIVKITSGLDASNRLAFWDYHVYFAGGDKAPTFYDVPHRRTTSYGGWQETKGSHPFQTGPWRGPNGNTNTFARESHMDILAAAAGADPLKFRLTHLKDARMLRVLDAAANAFGWSSSAAPSGKGQGLACVIYKGTYVATMGEVEVDKSTGQCKVKRVVCAQDMGQVVNPEGAKMQMEGCIMMGMGYALTESVHFRDGRILDTGLDTYRIPRFSWMPKRRACDYPYGCDGSQRDFRRYRCSTLRSSHETGAYQGGIEAVATGRDAGPVPLVSGSPAGAVSITVGNHRQAGMSHGWWDGHPARHFWRRF
jgi:isoquinoline 1-oxidoreductase